jgi:hypothetical protein
MTIPPYLFFEGRADEAVTFYQKVFGAELQMLMRYKDSPVPEGQIPPGSENKVLHMSMKIGDVVVLDRTATAQASLAFRALRYLTPRRTPRMRIACSKHCPTAARCECRWARRSFRRDSVWWRIASAFSGL